MAFFFGDGFDMYAAGLDATTHYDPASLFINMSYGVAGRFAGSRGFIVDTNTQAFKTSGSNDPAHHICVAMMPTQPIAGTSGLNFFTLYDGTTAQCTISFRSNGSIELRSGTATGTVLATYSGAYPVKDIWYAFEFEVVIHNTAGSFTVRKNGNNVNDFTAGSLNTRASANNYANKILMGSTQTNWMTIDDFLWRSDASVPWVGDIRCYTRYPLSDASVQFSITGQPAVYTSGGVFLNQGFAANTVTYLRFVAPSGGRVTSASFNCTYAGGGGTGHVKMALFTAPNNNTVGTALATSTEVTNPGATVIHTVTFPTPARVERGQSYWIGLIQDAAISFSVGNTANVIQMVSPVAYASWPVSDPSGLSAPSNYNIGGMTVTITQNKNADMVNEPQQDSTTSYVFGAASGLADLYTIQPITITPATVLGVTTRGYFTKSDAGTRNAAVRVKSGATTVQSATATLTPSNWSWVERTDTVDPATGAPWTAAAVNTINIGPVTVA